MEKQSNTQTCPFSPQGNLGNNYYFYVKEIDRVVVIKANQFKYAYLSKLARIDYWRTHYGSKDKRHKQGVDWNQVEIDLMDKCHNIGQFQGATVRTVAVRNSAQAITLAKNAKKA